MFKGFVTAFRTLSILPMPGQDAEDFSQALYGFTVVGAVIGSLLYLEAFLFSWCIGGQWPQIIAFILLLSGILLTRGFHLDGVADVADGFWGGYDRERTLAIMKDSFLGTFGVIALILVLLGKWIALVRVMELSAFHWIVSAGLISRTMMVELTVSYPYAREEGTAGAFIKGANQKHRWFSIGMCALLLFAVNGWPGLLVLLVAWIFSRLLGRWSCRRIGGISGDILGTCNELNEILVLLLAVGYEITAVKYL